MPKEGYEMLSGRGIYNGKKIQPLTRIPFEEKKRALITFIDEIAQDTMLNSNIDPVRALRGCATGSKLSQKLLDARREDREVERAKWGK